MSGWPVKRSLVSKAQIQDQCSFHFTQKFEQDDIPAVCCTSDTSANGENGWAAFLLLKLISLSDIMCLYVSHFMKSAFAFFHLSPGFHLICASRNQFCISWKWEQLDFTMFLRRRCRCEVLLVQTSCVAEAQAHLYFLHLRWTSFF